MKFSRRTLLKGLASTVLAPAGVGYAAPGDKAKRVIFFYFPDGVAAWSQDGDASAWHPQGSENNFSLPSQLTPLQSLKNHCLFFKGLSMGGFDNGSHPGGAKKLLTGVDGGGGESIDRYLARTIGAQSPHRHLYLGAMANQNNASGDKFVSYIGPGHTAPPEDNPRRAFERLFHGQIIGGPGPMTGPSADETLIDAMLEDFKGFRAGLGTTEKSKLDLHLEALREVEQQIKRSNPMMPGPQPQQCQDAPASLAEVSNAQDQLYRPENFPKILRAQMDLMVQAMACELTQVGVIQGSHHTSELVMSRFPGTEMHDPGFDMRSHQASHYGRRHDLQKREFADYMAQRRWWVSQFAYLIQSLKDRPEGSGTMLDNSLLVLCSEVSDGNTHSHDQMPFIFAGGAGGRISGGRLLDYNYARHSKLLVTIGQAMGAQLNSFGQEGHGALGRVLS